MNIFQATQQATGLGPNSSGVQGMAYLLLKVMADDPNAPEATVDNPYRQTMEAIEAYGKDLPGVRTMLRIVGSRTN